MKAKIDLMIAEYEFFKSLLKDEDIEGLYIDRVWYFINNSWSLVLENPNSPVSVVNVKQSKRHKWGLSMESPIGTTYASSDSIMDAYEECLDGIRKWMKR